MAFRERYGSGPLHVIAAVATLAIAGYALLEISERSEPLNFAILFAFAIVAHDLLAFPLYSAFGFIAGRALLPAGEVGRMALNHLRVPLILSGMAFVVWLPLIVGLSDALLEDKTGIGADVYFGRWLGMTALLFLGSGLLLAIRMRLRSRDAQAAEEA